MGFALYNSVGILCDEAGDDVYKTQGAACGTAGETRLGLKVGQVRGSRQYHPLT